MAAGHSFDHLELALEEIGVHVQRHRSRSVPAVRVLTRASADIMMVRMRTTLTLDYDVARLVEDTVHR
jgi:hypothetical protein